MFQHEILDNFASEISAATGILPVKHPKHYRTFDAVEYISYRVQPNKPIGKLTGGDTLYGICTFLVNYRSKKGEHWGLIEAQKVADVFPKFKKFAGIEIMDRPYISGYLDNKDGSWSIPVTVNYKIEDC